ncbi:hypothetical protein [Glaciimonas soli]|uniref:Uncharacterized protein n=1 Tax=Glaciimonas soli TaxID=2590999 RepID=A0A843YMT4_9BURK|nr:hypothetical protein [Glaciimonas soli]MQR00775.1 hypothetical protein [Glaciimonas soli]
MHPAVAPVCEISPSGYVSPTRVVNGSLWRVGGSAIVRNNRNQIIQIAFCGKGGCVGPARELEPVKSGTLVRAEYCTKMITRVYANDVEIYNRMPPTQNYLDQQVITGRHVVLGMFAFSCGLLLVGTLGVRRKADV